MAEGICEVPASPISNFQILVLNIAVLTPLVYERNQEEETGNTANNLTLYCIAKSYRCKIFKLLYIQVKICLAFFFYTETIVYIFNFLETKFRSCKTAAQNLNTELFPVLVH